MYSRIIGADVYGIEARLIQIEADVNDGLPVFDMVGFLASAVRESRERVKIAIKNLGLPFPAKRITVNLSPADLKKEGTSFDLPIAVALLTAFGFVPVEKTKNTLFVGELGLDGSIRSVKGVLAMIMEGKKAGIKKFIIPKDNEYESSLINDIEVYGLENIQDVFLYLSNKLELKECKKNWEEYKEKDLYDIDFSDIKGHKKLKRAAEIAVSGKHNLLMIGPAGSGKTMLAKRIPTILPTMSFEESLEVTKIYSISGKLSPDKPIIIKRPFRAPHHTITSNALIGGGNIPIPGEVTLATKGVLFLDELPEFKRETLEVLRQPLEDGKVMISRLSNSFEYPSDCIFIAAMNPCRCGFFPNRKKCRCSQYDVKRYLSKISEPMLDRMDICVETQMPQFKMREEKAESSEEIKLRVNNTINIQKIRYKNENFSYNSQLKGKNINKYCPLDSELTDFLEDYFINENCSMRKITRIIKVARTIADINESENILKEHMLEAISFRSIDRSYWGW